MCLFISKDDRVQIAQEDILCYKVLMTRRELAFRSETWTNSMYDGVLKDGVEFYTPYRFAPVDLTVPMESELIVEASKFGYKSNEDEVHVGIHSYSEWAYQSRTARPRLHEYTEGGIVAYEAKIPKGAQYFLGKFSKPGDSYASNKLVIMTEKPVIRTFY